MVTVLFVSAFCFRKLRSGYPRVAVAEGLDADQHPNIVPSLQLTLAPLHLVVVWKGLACSRWRNHGRSVSAGVIYQCGHSQKNGRSQRRGP